MITDKIQRGQSYNIGILFNPEYNKDNLQELQLYLGDFELGQLTEGTIARVGDLYIVRTPGKVTQLFKLGLNELTLHIQDSSIGVKKPTIARIRVNSSMSSLVSDVVGEVNDIVIPVIIDQNSVTTDDAMYNILMGTTAYEYAVLHGYEGTETQFGVLMNDIANQAQGYITHAEEVKGEIDATLEGFTESISNTLLATENARDASIAAKDASIVAKDASIVAKDASIAAKTYAEQLTRTVGLGQPAGYYTTKAALISSNPDHSYIYVVIADGKWYYWGNPTGTYEWTSGGVYQSPMSITHELGNDLALVISQFGLSNEFARVDQLINQLNSDVAVAVNGARVEEGKLYLSTPSGAEIGPLEVGTGGSGGGTGGGGSIFTLISSIPTSGAMPLGDDSVFNLVMVASSKDSITQAETGPLTMTVTVNSVQVISIPSQAQGEITIPIHSYLILGSNIVKVTAVDSYGSMRAITYTISVVDLRLLSSFDYTVPYEGQINFKYKPIGAFSKTIYFEVDGVEVATYTTLLSNKELIQVLPVMQHGARKLEVYAKATVSGLEVESNRLSYDIIYNGGTGVTIITSQLLTESIGQYDSMVIPFQVYNPVYETRDVVIRDNGVIISELSDVPRTEQTIEYRADDEGEHVITITSDGVTKTLQFEVTESIVQFEPEQGSLDLYLTSRGRSNNDSNKTQWAFTSGSGITTESVLTGFDYLTNGWLKDESNNTVLRLSGDAQVYIPFEIFGKDFKSNGRAIEIEFLTKDIANYEHEFFTCMNGNIGIALTPQISTFKSQFNTVQTFFKEDEKIKLTFIVTKANESHLIYTYIDGIMSGIKMYEVGNNPDVFRQPQPTGITIRSANVSTIDLYNIRVYDKDLSTAQVLGNYIADIPDVDTRLALFYKNDILDDAGEIRYQTLINTDRPYNIPVMILTGELPSIKGNKTAIDIEYIDPFNSANNFSITRKVSDPNADVQGTSSAGYPRKNYKLRLDKNTTQSGALTGKGLYKLVPEVNLTSRVFTLKADFAESSGTHNTGMAILAHEVLTSIGAYTPPQVGNIAIRTTVYGFPIVCFHRLTANDEPYFLGKYNFNLDKDSTDHYGFTNSWPSAESWEFTNNAHLLCLFQDDDFFSLAPYEDPTTHVISDQPTWLSAFEVRYSSKFSRFTIDVESFDLDLSDWKDYIQLSGSTHKYYVISYEIISPTVKRLVIRSLTVNGTVPVVGGTGTLVCSKDLNQTFNFTMVKEDKFDKDTPDPSRFQRLYKWFKSCISTVVPISFNGKLSDLDESHNKTRSYLILDETDVDNYSHKAVFDNETNSWVDGGLYPEMTPVIYGGVTYKWDTESYRIAKFRDEASQHFNLKMLIAYYLLTDIFGMTDQRAKNMFLATWGPEAGFGDECIWYPTLYDNDTLAGIKNTGEIAFDYTIERESIANGQYAYNGWASELWISLEKAFPAEIGNNYSLMRSTGAVPLTYLLAYNSFITNQSSKWSETIYNEDAEFKYVRSLQLGLGNYLANAQGSRADHRKWWLSNRFRFVDSKYGAGDFQSNFIYLRINTPDSKRYIIDIVNFVGTISYDYRIVINGGGDGEYNIVAYEWNGTTLRASIKLATNTGTVFSSGTVTYKSVAGVTVGEFSYTLYETINNDLVIQPSNNFRVSVLKPQYIRVRYSNLGVYQTKLASNVLTTIAGPADPVNDFETWVYGADSIKVLDSLASKYTGWIQFVGNLIIRELILGSDEPGYLNLALGAKADLEIGQLNLLQKLNVRNCPNVRKPLNLSGCPAIEEVDLRGTNVTSISLPLGGRLKKLYLPDVTSLVILHQSELTDDTFEVVLSRLVTLRIEHTNNIDVYNLLSEALEQSSSLLYIRVVGIDVPSGPLSVYLAAALKQGIDSYGNIISKAVITGSHTTFAAKQSELDYLEANYPDLEITTQKLAIEFTNPDVEEKMVAAKDTNADGYIDVDEVLTITSTENVFSNSSHIIEFSDISRFPNLTQLYIQGTSIEEITLPHNLFSRLYLPAMETLVIKNQPNLTQAHFNLSSWNSLKKLTIEPSHQLNMLTVILAMAGSPVLERFRILGINISATTNQSQTIANLGDKGGIDENGNNTASPVLTGTLYTDLLTPDLKAALEAAYPSGLTLTYGLLAIVFEDTAVRNIIMANFNTNGDGYFTSAEAEAVTGNAFGSLFYNNTTITKFNELKYFKNVKLGNSVNDSGGTWGTFQGTTNLTQVDISAMTYMSYGAFRESGISGHVAIPNNCQLSKINPEDNNWSGNQFYGCMGITSISIGTGISKLPANLFRGCMNITGHVSIPNDVLYIGDNNYDNGVFYYCNKITSITVGTGIISIRAGAFFGCSSLTSITILATTPPTMGTTDAFALTNNCPIYVPAGSVNAYKAATNWASYSSRIFAIQ